MSIVITCQCGRKLEAPDSLRGKEAICPACVRTIKIPNSPDDDVVDWIGPPPVGNRRDDEHRFERIQEATVSMGVPVAQPRIAGTKTSITPQQSISPASNVSSQRANEYARDLTPLYVVALALITTLVIGMGVYWRITSKLGVASNSTAATASPVKAQESANTHILDSRPATKVADDNTIQAMPIDLSKEAIKTFPDFASDTLRWLKIMCAEGSEIEVSTEVDGRVYHGKVTITFLDDYEYDVKRSDSIISPFIGELKITYFITITYLDLIGPTNIKNPPVTNVIKASYRDGKWNLDTDVKAIIEPMLKKGYSRDSPSASSAN